MERKSDMEIQRTIEQLDTIFFQRRDIFASQLEDGRYVCIQEPLTNKQIRMHLEGKITLGTYILDLESKARFMVLDADNQADFKGLLKLSSGLKVEGAPTYLETSRRGAHLWFFFDHPKPGSDIRAFGKGILKTSQLEGIELFPKQDQTKDGPGSCIRLPFGVHRLSAKRYPFIDPDGKLIAPSVREQVSLLAHAKPIPDEVFESYQALAPETGTKPVSQEKNGGAPWEKVKEQAPALEFIGAFVLLKRTVSGGVGKCPFHDDQHDSFGVNAEGNYWNCFAGCGGGSVIDFWMKWRDCDFKTAVKELADILL